MSQNKKFTEEELAHIRFNNDLAIACQLAADSYKAKEEPGKAEIYYRKAIEIYEKLSEKDPGYFKPYLAKGYSSLGVFYHQQGQTEEAERYYKRAIEIRERLAEENPGKFSHDLAKSYNNASVLYYKMGDLYNTELFFRKATDIFERLANESPADFNPDLAKSYFNYGLFTKDSTYLEKALALAKEVPDHPYCRKIIIATEKK